MTEPRKGSIRIRLTLAVVLTALVPLLAAVPLANNAIRQSTARFFVPEIRQRLDQSLELYNELAKAVKAGMRHQGTAIARLGGLRTAAAARDRAQLEAQLTEIFPTHPELVSLSVVDDTDRELARHDRGRPLDEQKELELRVVRPLDDAEEVNLIAVFATPRERFDQLEQMGSFVDEYSRIEERRASDDRAYLEAFLFLLGLTIVASAAVGLGLARSVSRRLSKLSGVTQQVGAGDFSARVEREGNDELTELGGAFNRMVLEIDTSRARIEYLRRVAAWQEMARRLAHEIKNPLTPIQLAVQEIHQRYGDGDPQFRKLLDMTLEIVEAEVGTLRRLVTEFSDFARLPEAHLERVSIRDYLVEQASQLGVPSFDEEHDVDGRVFGVPDGPVRLRFGSRGEAAQVDLDPQMFRRVLVNLIRNGLEAPRKAQPPRVHVAVEVAPREVFVYVDDDGPGIPQEMFETAFDPYVTTKKEGTGLGLAIVKKVVIEHGGAVSVGASPLGGARIAIVLPRVVEPAKEAKTP